jgi:hypothetical protein
MIAASSTRLVYPLAHLGNKLLLRGLRKRKRHMSGWAV